MPTPTLTTLINFTGSGTGNGADPLAGLALDANGDLIESDARQRVERAWKVPLTDEQANREPIA